MSQSPKKHKESAAKKVSSVNKQKNPGKKTIRSPKRKDGWWFLVFLVIAFILYSQSLNYGYVLDDQMVITNNAYVQKGVGGLPEIFANDSFLGFFQKKESLYILQGGRYRPLSLASFAVEHSIFGANNPGFSHFINILLYALTGFMLFRIISKLKIGEGNKLGFFSFPVIAAAIWLFHPLHTECVANIKGRDEMLALIFSLAAMSSAINYNYNKKTSSLILSGLYLFIGLLAKENALTFIAIIPLTIWFFRRSSASFLLRTSIPLVIAGAIFVFIRYEALGYFLNHGRPVTNLINDSFIGMDQEEKYATIFLTLGWYVKLLFVPYPLTHDYYPYHVPIMHWKNIAVIFSLLLYLFLIAWSLIKIRSRNFYAYAILFFLFSLSIVSNLFVSVGTFMNERFLYTPSVAFALALAYFLYFTLPSYINQDLSKKILHGALIIVALTFSWISISRVSDWRDPLTLDESAINVSPNSARANCFYAVSLYQAKYANIIDPTEKLKLLDHIEGYVNKALTIYPMYENAMHMETVVIGERFKVDHNTDRLLKDFETIIRKIPNNIPSKDNILSYSRYAIKLDSKKLADFCYKIGYEFYFKERKDAKTALQYLEVCSNANYNDPTILNATAEVYEASGNKTKADQLRKMAAGQNPQ